MKAIETIYKGYRFRSRLEARWAVFFDTLGLRWEYEPEGFELPSGARYLPDFRVQVPGGYIWYEVKPPQVQQDAKFDEFVAALEAARRARLAENAETDEAWRPCWTQLLSGEPGEFVAVDGTAGVFVCPRCGAIGQFYYAPDLYRCGGIGEYLLSVPCEPCDFDTPGGGYHPREQGLLAVCRPHKGTLLIEGRDEILRYLAKVKHAIAASRSARFEYDERERMAAV